MKVWKIGLILTVALVMSCKQNSSGPITMNLYYTGVDGNARKFVEEMESSGTADAIRAEEDVPASDQSFIRK